MLSEDVYEILLDKLLTRELPPGQILNRRDLAEMLGTSTAPVLEALKQLEFDGYIETIPRKFTRVKQIDADDVIGNYITRVGLECMAVRMITVTHALKAAYNRLLVLAERAESTRAQFGDAPESWKTDLDFHLALVETCENRRIAAEYRKIALPNLFYRSHYVILPEANAEWSSHVLLLNQLRDAPDPDTAERIIREHIIRYKPVLTSLLT